MYKAIIKISDLSISHVYDAEDTSLKSFSGPWSWEDQFCHVSIPENVKINSEMGTVFKDNLEAYLDGNTIKVRNIDG